MLLERMARFLDEIGSPADDVRCKAKAHLLDSLVMIVAAREHPLTLQAARARMPFAGGGAAAFRAGVACDALGLDDFDEPTRTHPGAVVVPALIGGALESEQPVSGAAMLAGLVAGYEVTCRFGEIAGAASLHDRGFHPSSVCGVVGAAAGVSVMLGVDRAVAIGLAASLASGVFELDGRGAVKGLQTGWAACGAVTAARLAHVGYVPAPSVLDGPKGLLRALGEQPIAEDSIPKAFGRPLRIERVSFKPYSHFTDLHPATAALLSLLRDERVSVEDVAGIEVHLSKGVAARLNTAFPPVSPRLARRCPRFALAATMCRADPDAVADPLLHAFDQAALEDPQIIGLAERVSWSDDLTHESASPVAVVTLRRKGGGAVTAQATGYPGDGRRAEHRWSWPEVARRGSSLLPVDARDLIDLVETIETLVDARPLAERLAACLEPARSPRVDS